VRLDGCVRYPGDQTSKRIPFDRADRVADEVLVQEDVDLARWQARGALAKVIQQPPAMLRPGLSGKLPYPQVGGEARVCVEGGKGRFEGDFSASKTLREVTDPARQPDLPAFQREPTLSDHKRGFSIMLARAAPLIRATTCGIDDSGLIEDDPNTVGSELAACDLGPKLLTSQGQGGYSTLPIVPLIPTK
jgi:hypothetical protein